MINELDAIENETFSLGYNFSFNEITLLAKLFRKNQDCLPDGLESFSRFIENSVYNSLSLEQIRELYEK